MITAIGMALADVMEIRNEHQKAYDVYVDAFKVLEKANEEVGLTGSERLRAVAIGHKLGGMVETCGKTTEEEAKWLVFAVEEILKLVRDAQKDKKLQGRGPVSSISKPLSLGEIELPDWIRKTDVGAPLESLAAFYRRTGNYEYVARYHRTFVSLCIIS